VSYPVSFLALILGATFVLASCATAEQPANDVAPGSSDSIESVELEVIPEFIEGGTALENQPYADYIIQSVLADAESNRAGPAVAEALESAGFVRENMELTPDVSLIQLPVDSTTVAIRVDTECFIGQWGKDWYVSQVEPVLATGLCLVGETVSLD
jgi:hypothetical protein